MARPVSISTSSAPRHSGRALCNERYAGMTPETQATPAQTRERNLAVRILFGVLWFVGFRILTGALIGAVVGAIAGASTTSFEAGQRAGYHASVDFFHKYGVIVSVVQVLAFIPLCVFGLLPGVRKYKKLRQT